jgi:hypothetical protein
MKKNAKNKRPLGKLSPWVWSIEFVRGCNLKCWHCTAKLMKKKFMTLETWEAMCKVMASMTPYRRLELAQAGEPTLHPHLLECLRIAKRITPNAAVIDPKKILVLPFSNLGQGGIPARNWVWEHSISIGAKRHWILVCSMLSSLIKWQR